MEFGHGNARQVVEEDRLSHLPDELLHKILSCFDMKFVVQTSVLSSRWKLLWTSMLCLNFSSEEFDSLLKFAKFVTHVLSHRNHQIDVSFVKLEFEGAGDKVSVEKIAKYAISHNVQEVAVVIRPSEVIKNYPACLFSSQSLKQFTLGLRGVSPYFVTLDTPLDFPALTTMHLSGIRLCGDLFSKCVNLKNLTLQRFFIKNTGALDIITPRLSNLILIRGAYVKVINVNAPKLENLTLIDCFELEYLNAPPLSKTGFHSLNKVTFGLNFGWSASRSYYACKTIPILQQLHSAKYLTLSPYMIESLSSVPDLLSPHPSPFSNLISLTIDSSMMNDGYKVKMSTEAKRFLLQNSPNATLN